MQEVKFTQGVILQRENWREKDLALTCFTQHFGRVRILAFGAASVKSLRGKRAQPFRLLSLQLSVTADSQGHYKNFNLVEIESDLTEFFPIGKPDNRQQLLRLASGYYVNECFLRLNKYLEIGYQPIHLIKRVFTQLSTAERKTEFAVILRHFELQLFKLFGYDLYHFDPSLSDTQAERWCYGLYHGWCVAQDNNAFLIHQEIQQLTQLSDWQSDALDRLKHHNRQLINELLGSDSLRSRQWVREQLQMI